MKKIVKWTFVALLFWVTLALACIASGVWR